MIYRLNPPDGPLRSDQKIVKAAEYAAIIESESLVAESREKARRLLAEAEEQAAEILQRARQQAEELQQEARTAGLQEGLIEAKEQAAALIIHTSQRSVEHLAHEESNLAQVVMHAIERVFDSFDNPELVLKLVRGALQRETDLQQVRLRVHPGSVRRLREELDNLRRDFPHLNAIHVTEDPTVAERGCVLQSDMGTIEAGLEVQLRAIRNALARTHQAHPKAVAVSDAPAP